ncbi:MAG: tetratricopeptide repeat protein [Rhodospirillales bacterium]|nr:MAG: tetratricopeptide repeat protein [Rhodospirillales bacterium]
MDDAAALFKQALAHQGEGRWAEARALYEPLLAAHPELNAVRNNLAVCCLEMGAPELSLDLLLPLAVDGAGLEVKTNLGNALRALGRFAEAEAAYGEVAAKAPMDPRAVSNLALACQDQGRLEEAVAGFERAVALAPNEPSLRANLGGAYLMAGDYANGFAAHEFRLAGSAAEAAMKKAGLALWDGSSLKGRRLLVWTEQGLGDTLQFLRFLPLTGGWIVLMAQGALHRLAAGIETVEHVAGWNDPIPDCDVQVALLSLPRHLGIDGPDKIPPSLLSADPLLCELWGQRLAHDRLSPSHPSDAEINVNRSLIQIGRADSRPQSKPEDGFDFRRSALASLKGRRVGLSWQGNPAMKADRFRSAPLSVFQPLFALPGVSWVSLQTGPGREQLADIKTPLLDLGGEIADLADTAAIMSHLDLVISVDSAVAHLAGCLNRPVWAMVRANPDWRWPPGHSTTPWYPTARLWRQERLGDWSLILDEMVRALPTYI